MSQAWYTARLIRVEKMPELETLLIDENESPKKEEKQTNEALMAVCKLWNAALGGGVVEVTNGDNVQRP